MSKAAHLTDDERLAMHILIIENDDKSRDNRKTTKGLLPDVIKKIGRDIALDTLYAEMAEIHKKSFPVDKPWCIGTISPEYPIPAENVILTVLISKQFNKMAEVLGLGETFTIRQALWCNRLMGYTPFLKLTDDELRELSEDDLKKMIQAMQSLVTVASRYAAWERSKDIFGGKFDTSQFDAMTIDKMKENTDAFFGSVMTKRKLKDGEQNG
jgi:hypothetical protein